MKIDELIAKLQKFKEKNGNLDVNIALAKSTWKYGDGINMVVPLDDNDGVLVGQTRVGEHRDEEKDIASLFLMGFKPKGR